MTTGFDLTSNTWDRNEECDYLNCLSLFQKWSIRLLVTPFYVLISTTCTISPRKRPLLLLLLNIFFPLSSKRKAVQSPKSTYGRLAVAKRSKPGLVTFNWATSMPDVGQCGVQFLDYCNRYHFPAIPERHNYTRQWVGPTRFPRSLFVIGQHGSSVYPKMIACQGPLICPCRRADKRCFVNVSICPHVSVTQPWH